MLLLLQIKVMACIVKETIIIISIELHQYLIPDIYYNRKPFCCLNFVVADEN